VRVLVGPEATGATTTSSFYINFWTEYPVALASDLDVNGWPSDFAMVGIERDPESRWHVKPPSTTCPNGGAPPCVRRLRLFTSLGGATWTDRGLVSFSGGPSAISSAGRPSISYDAVHDVFHMVYAKYEYNDASDGGICMATLSRSSWVWSNHVCFGGLDGWTRANSGLGISCEDFSTAVGSSFCSIYYAGIAPYSPIVEMLVEIGAGSPSGPAELRDLKYLPFYWTYDDVGAVFRDEGAKSRHYAAWSGTGVSTGMWQAEKNCDVATGGPWQCTAKYASTFYNPPFQSWTGFSLGRGVDSTTKKLFSAWAGD